MTFRLDLANRANLFGNYASWHEDGNGFDKSHVSFSFSICFLINSLENIHKYKLESLRQFEILESELKGTSNEICFQSPSLFDIFSEFSTSLVQMRVIQNKLLELISKKVKRSYPSSMNEYIKKYKNREKKGSEINIYNLISDYWIKNGLRVKQYRDIDQHHGQLFKNAVVVKNGDTVNLELRLPDNPQEKKWNRLTYHKKIDAIAFIQESFVFLQELINDVSVALGYVTERLFDLNIDMSESYENYLTITFDPYQGIIMGQEFLFENGEDYCAAHAKECNLEEFSFVKVPEYFKGKPMSKRNFIVGEKLKWN
ncbi:MAG: hypothetical protein LAT65_09140 [Saccharospirillum sp.]|nr:hypothetical protein [Saccharospirillum sp.]